jgi:hypothetical protein
MTGVDEKKEKEKKVLASSRLTSFFSENLARTMTVTILFWSDGTVTWVPEE